MEASKAIITTCVPVAILVLLWAWKVVSWLWLRPKKLERLLRQQGLQGNPYRLLTGDSTEMFNMHMQAKSKPMNLSHDILPRASSFVNHIVNKYGMLLIPYASPTPLNHTLAMNLAPNCRSFWFPKHLLLISYGWFIFLPPFVLKHPGFLYS